MSGSGTVLWSDNELKFLWCVFSVVGVQCDESYCSGHGTCSNFECSCERTYYGDFCQYKGVLFCTHTLQTLCKHSSKTELWEPQHYYRIENKYRLIKHSIAAMN